MQSSDSDAFVDCHRLGHQPSEPLMFCSPLSSFISFSRFCIGTNYHVVSSVLYYYEWRTRLLANLGRPLERSSLFQVLVTLACANLKHLHDSFLVTLDV